MSIWRSTPRSRPDLSPRQLEVLGLVAQGCTDAEIGVRLWLTEAGVRNHLNNIFAKLGGRNRAHCVRLARQQGLLKPSAAPPARRASTRQRQIVALIGDGLSNDEIAAALGISLGSVKTHMDISRSRLDARNRAHLVSLEWADDGLADGVGSGKTYADGGQS